ncbi:tail fiber assembly protein [Serratia quinivorans]|uniref:tail fiber assembly protein n=1 Tax=Serratia quinivorans TaxID=137545 RepID=UPI0039648B3D
MLKCKIQFEVRKRHSVLLSRVDTDKAPDIAWPDKPEWVRDCMNDNNQHKLR